MDLVNWKHFYDTHIHTYNRTGNKIIKKYRFSIESLKWSSKTLNMFKNKNRNEKIVAMGSNKTFINMK